MLTVINQSDLMFDTMRLWTGARLADRGWRCFGSDNLGAEKLPNQLRPPGWTPLPPYLDYQLVAIIMNRYLSPLRKKVLNQLQAAVRSNDPGNWYTIFLTCFVLLHSCEMTAVIIRKHATKRKSPVSTEDTPSRLNRVMICYFVCRFATSSWSLCEL